MPELYFGPYIQSPIEPVQADLYLSESFPFYQRLNEGNKKKFLSRLYYFIERKRFVPRQDLYLTDEMRVIIGACAIQLTFGLEVYTMDYFETILVYPDIYKSPHSDYMHHGEVNLAGFICFSWQSVKKGIGLNDNFNVGLHEWSHALRFNGFKGDECDTFFEGYFLKWLAASNVLYNKIRGGKDQLFNKYAGTNLGEFFPVMMEHFFENPDDFKTAYPEEYEYTCVLLNQDPTNKVNPGVAARRNVISKYKFAEGEKIILQGTSSNSFGSYTAISVVLALLAFISIINSALICSIILVALLVIPVLLMASSRRKVYLTSSGLIETKRIADPFNRYTERFPWEQIVTVEFDEETNGSAQHGYSSLHFNVFTLQQEFDRHALHTYVSYQDGEKLEKFLRARKIGVVRRKR